MAHWVVWAILYGRWPTTIIDHRDGVGTNNREGNLREATYDRNMANRRRWAQHTNMRGAYFRKARGNWIAVFKRKYLGMYDSELAAHEAWKKAAVAHYGEFARFD